mmetsp:Transcript_129716/g.229313  ORF Transcript_129716/g.229313 Transcript_129716/m.229313 type:complete len:235 (-) Transcript_129716:104-808(-)
MATTHCDIFGSLRTVYLKRARRQWKREKGLRHWARSTKICLQLVWSNVLKQVFYILDEHDFLFLPISHECLHNSREASLDHGHVADVKLPDAARMLLGEHIRNFLQRAQRNLRDGQALEIHNDDHVFNSARYCHVPIEVLDHKYKTLDQSLDTCTVAQVTWCACRTRNEKRAHGGVTASKVNHTICKIWSNIYISNWPIAKIIRLPVLRFVHALQGLVHVATCVIQESCCCCCK